jgi:hypothetical protein
MKVILPRAVVAVGRVLPEVAGRLRMGVNADEADDETLRINAIHLYTRPEIFRGVNQVMRVYPDDQPAARL